jgi:transcriptional regulator with XRE-family HTH domain
MLEIGGSLREARARAGLELREVEAATMIPARYLDAIEGERFEVLPAGPYRRSFICEYAEYLGLRGDVYAEEYVSRFEPPEPDPEPEPIRSSAARQLSRALDEVTLRRAAVAAGLLAAAVGVWLLGTGGSSGGRPHATPAARTATPVLHHVVRARPKPKPAAPFIPAVVPPALTLAATRGDCWLELRVGSSTGPIVYEHTLRRGEAARFGLRKTLWIRLGAPWNLDAKIGSRSVTSQLPDRTGDAKATAHGVSAS